MNISETDKKIVRAMQGAFPVCSEPYKEIAAAVGISEDALLKRLEEMKQDGTLRKMGAVLRHRQVGFKANALGTWVVPRERMDEVAEIMCAHPEVTHCYDRNTLPDWPYNFYTMIHGDTEEGCRKFAEKLSQETGIKEYSLQFTRREWKKTSMKYFME